MANDRNAPISVKAVANGCSVNSDLSYIKFARQRVVTTPILGRCCDLPGLQSLRNIPGLNGRHIFGRFSSIDPVLDNSADGLGEYVREAGKDVIAETGSFDQAAGGGVTPFT